MTLNREQFTEVSEIIETIRDSKIRTDLKYKMLGGGSFESIRDAALDAAIDEHVEGRGPAQSTLFDEGREIVKKDVSSKEELSAEMARRSSKPRIGLKNVPALMARFLSGASTGATLAAERNVTEANIGAAVFGRTYSRHYVSNLSAAIEMLEKSGTYRFSNEDRDSLGKHLGSAVRAWFRGRCK
jgi:hypothetical protein